MSRQVTELDINDVVKEGEAVQMKQFLQVNEYAIIDKTRKGMHPTDERYLFDWKKMCKLSPEAQAFYRKVELGLEKQTKGWLQLDPKDTSKKEKQFIGFNSQDIIGHFHIQSAVIGFNAWIESETEVVRFKSDNRKQRWCKVKILNLTMNNSIDYPVPTIMNAIYKRVELPSGIL